MKFFKIFRINWFKSILFSLFYFKFKDAIKLPIFVYRRTKIIKLGGRIQVKGTVKTGMLKIGPWGLGTQDTSFDRTLWQVTGTITIGNTVTIGRGTSISCAGNLNFGDNFSITGASSIICKDTISFGNDCLMSWDCLVMDTDCHKILDEHGNVINDNKPISVGNKVWIGCRNTILKGAVISDNCVIAANSTITKYLENSNCIYGNRGSVLKHNVDWKR